jgi:hypothetical protein
MIPNYWKDFLESNDLAGKEIEFPWPGEADLSAIIEILSYKCILTEATEYWPGKGVIKDGYIPVGHCSIGTGDPFFINIHDGPNGPIYKIVHEEVNDENYDKKKAVYVMLDSYEQLLGWYNKNELKDT